MHVETPFSQHPFFVLAIFGTPSPPAACKVSKRLHFPTVRVCSAPLSTWLPHATEASAWHSSCFMNTHWGAFSGSSCRLLTSSARLAVSSHESSIKCYLDALGCIGMLRGLLVSTQIVGILASVEKDAWTLSIHGLQPISHLPMLIYQTHVSLLHWPHHQIAAEIAITLLRVVEESG